MREFEKRLMWGAVADYRHQRIFPELKSRALFSVVSIPIVHGIGHRPMAGAMVENKRADVGGETEPGHFCSDSTPEVVRRSSNDAEFLR